MGKNPNMGSSLGKKGKKVDERRILALVETLEEMIWETDKKGLFTYVSPRSSYLFGVDPEEVRGKPFAEFMPKGELEKAKQFYDNHIASQKPFSGYETKFTHKDGHDYYIETRGVPFFSEKGEFLGYRGIAFDITKRKLAEQALKERKKEIERKSQNLEEANVALKVLLRRIEEDRVELEEKVISNVKELIFPYLEELKRSPLSERQRGFLEIAESNLKHIVSPFLRRLSLKYQNVTPREIQVANLVKEGKTTKDIASLLCTSMDTISGHRKSLREKLGIKSKKINLRSYLLSLQ